MEIAIDLIIVVTAGLIGGIVTRKLNQPLIFGYIIAGIIIGPYTGGVPSPTRTRSRASRK